MYPKFFTGQSKSLFKSIAKSESSINYKNLSNKILLPDGKFHEFNSLKNMVPFIACWKI